jgi:hypothetical protein
MNVDNNSAPSTMAVIAIVLPAAMMPRAVAPTMCILHFTSIENVYIARSVVATVDSAWRRRGTLRVLTFPLFAPQECQRACPFDRLTGEAAFARSRRWGWLLWWGV